jgi:hypothetical protein
MEQSSTFGRKASSLGLLAAAAPAGEQSAGPAKGAFERRAADFDVSVLLHSHSLASRLTLGAQSVS